MIDDYQHLLSPGQEYLEGHYLEYNDEDNKKYHYTITKSKKVFFYKECVVYPFVSFEISKKKVYLSKRDYVNMVYYLEQTGLSSI